MGCESLRPLGQKANAERLRDQTRVNFISGHRRRPLELLAVRRF